MNRGKLAVGLLLGIATLVFLPLRLPATVLGALIASQTQGKVTLAAAEGSFWHGSAQPLVGGEAIAERLNWDIHAAELLRGRLVYDLRLDGGGAELSVGKGGLTLSHADLTVAGAPLFKLDERMRSYALDGQLHLASPSLHWAAGSQPQGALSLDWRGAGSNLTPAMNPLGDYHVDATPAGAGWHLQFSTLGGSLQINGGGDWDATRGLTVDLGLKPSPGTETALGVLLSRIGPGAPDAERRLQFNFR